MTGGSDMEWMSLNTDEPVRMGETYYHYDTANQLVREDNMWLGKTFLWTYDDAGNITSCKEYAYINNWEDVTGTPTKTNTYTYGDSAWGDLLTAYNGVQWSYDQIGNLPNDGTWTYTWQNGRELASMSDGETTWTYTYDANGMRTSRTDGTTTYSYIYNGGKLIQMTRGTDTLEFYYDAVGAPVIVKYNGEVYNYVTTLQGDVMLILDTDGEIVVTYDYDAWGGHMTVSGSMASTLGAVNPLTYRGYVYDTETGLYYLQSRCYNPEIGRFINADIYAATGQGLLGNNMFAYCNNNPVNLTDDDGDFGVLASVLLGAVAGIASQFVSGVVANALEGKTGVDLFKGTGTVGEYVTSAITGAICAIPGANATVSVLCDVAAPAVQQGIDCLVSKDCEWSWGEYASDVATNLVCDVAVTNLSADVPQYIRDVKDEAHSLGKKGTKELNKYLNKVQNQTFLINQGIGVLSSAASEVYASVLSKVISMF